VAGEARADPSSLDRAVGSAGASLSGHHFHKMNVVRVKVCFSTRRQSTEKMVC
jgi:hypothetical protein